MTQTIRFPLYAIRHGQIGGTEFAIYNLLKGLAGAGVRIEASYGRESDLSPDFLEWARQTDTVKLRRQGGLPGPKGVRFLEELLFQQRPRNTDWAIFPNYFCPTRLIRHAGKRCVILHDIQYKRFPQYHSFKRRMWLNAYLPQMFSSADSVILISQSELSLVRKYFGEDAAELCDVVYNAIDYERFSVKRFAISDNIKSLVKKDYILSVCHQFPHKNLSTLLKAFVEICRTDSNINLYLVGSSSKNNDEFIAKNIPESARNRIHFTGFVSDTELGQFYANAKLFALPSLYEGFGMPAVEALGLGVPTLVSDAYALPEVTLGHAELVANPLDAGEWAAKIREMIRSGRRPTPEQVTHVQATYHPTAIARSLLAVLNARQSRQPRSRS